MNKNDPRDRAAGQNNGGVVMRDTVILAKCECGNKVNVNILNHLNTVAKATHDKKNAALIGMANCKKCGKDIWIYSFIEIKEPQLETSSGLTI